LRPAATPPEQAAKEAALTALAAGADDGAGGGAGLCTDDAGATALGAEVQRPLATVVVGGLVTSTLLTLLILPTLYPLLAPRRVSELPKEAQRYPEEA
jgi:hypothetical protein